MGKGIPPKGVMPQLHEVAETNKNLDIGPIPLIKAVVKG
jgi:hypothetical protein